MFGRRKRERVGIWPAAAVGGAIAITLSTFNPAMAEPPAGGADHDRL